MQTSETTQSHWLTANEAANYLRIESRTLLLWVRQGHMKGYVLSGTRRQTWRFLRVDLDDALKANFPLKKPCVSVVAPSVALPTKEAR